MNKSLQPDKNYYPVDVPVPMILKVIQCVLPFIVIGAGTIHSGDHFVGFWWFYGINCILFPVIMINFTPFYTQVWRRVKETYLWPTHNTSDLFIATILGIIGFFLSFLSGYLDRASESGILDGVKGVRSEMGNIAQTEEKLSLLRITYIIFFVLVTAFGNPIFEEFYWRMFTLETFATDGKVDTPTVRWVTSIFYGVYHFWIPFTDQGPVAGIIFAIAVIAYGYLLVHQRLTVNMFNALLIHLGMNLGQPFMLYFQRVVSVTIVWAK
ncbi:unnamed protein product [Moneuplotes crassus]|uniref:CAAX prenyl protease 2/Lysostaphin resistance protein A-like domain-containing protein n=1 Tax=Euplotes crassus TaxID=5936 RepID=A0AAD1XPP1_EUPCR|nr:unnamed protein product [Moneuplotes crassus]